MNETLAGYVDDMIAVERDVHQMLRRHRDEAVVQHRDLAHDLLERAESATDRNLAVLQDCRRRLGGEDEGALKKAVGAVAGMASQLYERVRQEDKASRILRDDYTALSFATICYEMLHATALAVREPIVADVALTNLKAYTPLVMEIGMTMPEVVIEELADEGKATGNADAATAALRNVRDAWHTGAEAEGQQSTPEPSPEEVPPAV